MERQSVDIDNVISEIRDQLSPIQAAQWIIFIEQNKYRNEFRCHEHENLNEIEEEDIKKMRKKVKR
jgi:hypothetical protein